MRSLNEINGKRIIDNFQKARGKAWPLGTIKEFGGVEMIKLADGWKNHGKHKKSKVEEESTKRGDAERRDNETAIRELKIEEGTAIRFRNEKGEEEKGVVESILRSGRLSIKTEKGQYVAVPASHIRVEEKKLKKDPQSMFVAETAEENIKSIKEAIKEAIKETHIEGETNLYYSGYKDGIGKNERQTWEVPYNRIHAVRNMFREIVHEPDLRKDNINFLRKNGINITRIDETENPNNISSLKHNFGVYFELTEKSQDNSKEPLPEYVNSDNPKTGKTRYTGDYNGENYLHVFELEQKDGITWLQYKGSDEDWVPLKAMKKMGVSLAGLKSYEYSGYSKGSEGFNDFFKEKQRMKKVVRESGVSIEPKKRGHAPSNINYNF